MRRRFRRRLPIVLAAMLFGTTHLQATESPNIVLILADDMGWTGASAQMDPDEPDSISDYHQTPNIEALAAAGMRFSDAYATPVCSPTRAAIQTGKSSAQLQMTDVTAGGDPKSSRYTTFYTNRGQTPPLVRRHLPAEEETIAERIGLLAPHYKTGLFGKWHLTYLGGPHPLEQGYDESTAGLNPNLTDDENPKHIVSLTDRSIRFMEDRVAEQSPFFLSIQHYAPHLPWQAKPETIEKYENLPFGDRHRNALYAAMTEDMDTGIGRVLDAIDNLGIADNTYVIFASDNGPIGTGRATETLPLYEFKGTNYEGGIRVPLIVAGPGIEAGTFSDVPVTLQDLYATVSDLAGIEAPLGAQVESATLRPILENGGDLPAGTSSLQRNYGPNGELFFHSPHYFGATPLGDRTPSSAIRDGDFKLIRFYGEAGQPDQVFLFNIGANVSETRDPLSPLNLVGSMPEKAAALEAKLDQWLQDVDASLPYFVGDDLSLAWHANAPGSDPAAWRSVNDVDHYFRERWERPSPTAGPTLESVAPHQPRLGNEAFDFDATAGLQRKFFHVADAFDNDHSAAFELWLTVDDLTRDQVLIESGDQGAGLSLSLGDSDSDGIHNDLRLRILGKDGQYLTVDAPVDTFADPTSDFIHVAAVYNDDSTDRHAAIYVNGALRGRVDGVPGAGGSLEWDGVDAAGLGANAGVGVGGNGGAGDLPFVGTLAGQLAMVRFSNTARDAESIREAYNEMLSPAWQGVGSLVGDTAIAFDRPASLAQGNAESTTLNVLLERIDVLDNQLSVDVQVLGPTTLSGTNFGDSGELLADAEIASYLLQYDPIGDDAGAVDVLTGSITFEQDILAILWDSTTLTAADHALGAIGDYGDSASRGLLLAGDDFVGIASDLRTLSYSLSVGGDEMIQWRVVTGGQSDFGSLLLWETSYGVDDKADLDNDSLTGGSDFLAMQRQWAVANSGPGAAAGRVPEPAAVVLSLLAISGCLAARRSARAST